MIFYEIIKNKQDSLSLVYGRCHIGPNKRKSLAQLEFCSIFCVQLWIQDIFYNVFGVIVYDL